MLLFATAVLLFQAVSRPALWLDELAVVRGATSTPWSALVDTSPRTTQLAPPLFLAALKGIIAVLGSGDLILRGVSLAFAILALVSALALGRELFGAGVLARLPPLLLSLAPLPLRYGSEVKPYIVDCATTLLGLWLALRCVRVRSGATGWGAPAALAVLAVVAPWISGGAVFGAAAALATLIVSPVAGGFSWRPRLALALAWVASTTVAFVHQRSVLSPAMAEYLEHYWRRGLAPEGADLSARLSWLGDAVLDLVGRTFEVGRGATFVFAAFAVAGLFSLARRRPEVATGLIAPGVLIAGAAWFRLYPLQGRLALAALPALLFGGCEGVRWLVERLGRRWPERMRSVAAAVPPAAAALATFVMPPLGNLEPVPQLLARLAAERRPSEPVYVFYAAWQALCHYGPKAGLDLAGVEIGGCHRGAPEVYGAELGRFAERGGTWVLFTHDSARRGERAAILELLDRAGSRTAAYEIPGRGEAGGPVAALYRYELPSAAAASLGLGRSATPAPDCRIGPHVPPVAPAPAAEVCASGPGG